MTCKWDSEADTYLNDGEKCRVDEYGDPTNHCNARKTCSQHVGVHDQTCARCIGRTRTNIKRLIELSPLYALIAEEGHVDREAMSLAGPTAHFPTWETRFGNRRIEILDAYSDNETLAMKHLGKLDQERDDDNHPTLLLERWVTDLAAAYNLKAPALTNISTLGDWLDNKLGKFAQDPDQEFGKFAREVRDCLTYVETELTLRRDHKTIGVSCPTCAGVGVKARLVRLYAHWCDDEACERIHVADESGDVWRCPKNREHEWKPEAYRNYIEDRTSA